MYVIVIYLVCKVKEEGERMGNQNKIRKTICIKPNLWEEAKEVSDKIGTSISTLISMAIIEKLNKIQNEKK